MERLKLVNALKSTFLEFCVFSMNVYLQFADTTRSYLKVIIITSALRLAALAPHAFKIGQNVKKYVRKLASCIIIIT